MSYIIYLIPSLIIISNSFCLAMDERILYNYNVSKSPSSMPINQKHVDFVDIFSVDMTLRDNFSSKPTETSCTVFKINYKRHENSSPPFKFNQINFMKDDENINLLKIPFFNEISVNEIKITVPQDFILDEQQIDEIKSIKSEERVKRIVSYFLEDQIHKVSNFNPELASLYLISSIWAGNDNIDLLNEINDIDDLLIEKIKNSDKSQDKIECLVKELRYLWIKK